MFSWSILNFFSPAESAVTFYAFLFTIIDRSLRTDSTGSVCRGLSHLSLPFFSNHLLLLPFSCVREISVRWVYDRCCDMLLSIFLHFLFWRNRLYWLVSTAEIDRILADVRFSSGQLILSISQKDLRWKFAAHPPENMSMYLTRCCVMTISSFFLSLIKNLQVTLGQPRRRRLSELVDILHTVIDDECMSTVSSLVHLAQNKRDELCISITTPINGSLRTH